MLRFEHKDEEHPKSGMSRRYNGDLVFQDADGSAVIIYPTGNFCYFKKGYHCPTDLTPVHSVTITRES